MSLPEMIELSRVDFVTIDTVGPPGERTFYLQAAQDDMLITVVIEKEHAAALSIAIRGMLEQLGETEGESESVSRDLVYPVEPLFRVGHVGLGYDQGLDMLVVMVEELVRKDEQGTKVHIWASRVQMAQLARKAAVAVASGRPICPLCGEVMDAGEKHICVKGNGRKRLYQTD
jgi:uncharacterized repeat protein (TIGR03847 family)